MVQPTWCVCVYDDNPGSCSFVKHACVCDRFRSKWINAKNVYVQQLCLADHHICLCGEITSTSDIKHLTKCKKTNYNTYLIISKRHNNKYVKKCLKHCVGVN